VLTSFPKTSNDLWNTPRVPKHDSPSKTYTQAEREQEINNISINRGSADDKHCPSITTLHARRTKTRRAVSTVDSRSRHTHSGSSDKVGVAPVECCWPRQYLVVWGGTQQPSCDTLKLRPPQPRPPQLRPSQPRPPQLRPTDWLPACPPACPSRCLRPWRSTVWRSTVVALPAARAPSDGTSTPRGLVARLLSAAASDESLLFSLFSFRHQAERQCSRCVARFVEC
jgi:hypothetical protein